MRREDFAVPLAASIRHLAVRIDEPAGDDLHRELAAIWAARRDEIDRIVARTESLGRLAADRDPPLVICHADVHAWNVLVTPDEGIAIVDWDGTFLAPRECDLMFVGDRGGGMEHDAGAFAAGYGQLDADPVVAAFYRYRWVTEEDRRLRPPGPRHAGPGPGDPGGGPRELRRALRPGRGRRGRPPERPRPGPLKVLVVRARLRQHVGHERKEVVRLHTSHETLEVTGC